MDNGVLLYRYQVELAEFRSLPYYRQCNEGRYLNYKFNHSFLSWLDAITYVNLDLDYEFYTYISTISDPESITVLANKHHQLPGDYTPQDLEEINPDYSIQGLLLRHTARIAFEEMCREAGYEGITLTAISTYRSYDYQEKVYFSKKSTEINLEAYQRERDKVSARAGHSEHQTGLAVDINDLEETFELTQEGKWLAVNSYRYGFILRYPKGKEFITGYSYEPWHFRYIGTELAKVFYFHGLTFDEFYIRYLSHYPL
jgi:D-alanyl-D-alanine carboxypeptidase